MTEQEKKNYELMRATLQRIARDYQSPEELRENCESQYGLDFSDALEMSYDNIQSEAAATLATIITTRE